MGKVGGNKASQDLTNSSHARWRRRHGRKLRSTGLRIEALEPRMVLAASVVISEFMASNRMTLADEDGEFPDWIELYNASSTPVNLNGWYLTDAATDLNKWRIPDVTIDPKEYLIVFASDKDRVDPAAPLHTNFRLSATAEYLALVEPDGTTVAHEYTPAFPAQLTDVSFGLAQDFTTLELAPSGAAATAMVPSDDSLGDAWQQAGFNDSAWIDGTTGIGFERAFGYQDLIGLDVGDQMWSQNGSSYMRIPFEVSDPSQLSTLLLRMKYDDGFVAYINGVEVWSENAPGELAWDSAATASHSDSLAVQFQDFDISAHLGALEPGANILAIHGLNAGATNSDFLVLPELTAVVAGEIQPEQPLYLMQATPGEPNGLGAPGVSPSPIFSVDTGNYVDNVTVELSVDSPTATIRYTTDGSAPDTRARVYTGPISVTASMEIRARSFDGELLPSVESTETYVILDSAVQSFNSNLPIVVVDTFGRTIGQNDFTLIHASVIDIDQVTGRAGITDELNFGGRGGLKVRGSSSTGFPKKQWAFEAWDEFGDDLETQILSFPAESDYILYAPYTDKALMQNTLAYEWSNRIGQYAPRTQFVELYYNTGGKVGTGDYHGVYVLMEKIKRDPNRVDIEKLTPSQNSEPEITGGYILKKDRLDPGDSGINAGGHTLGLVEPKEDEITPAQRDWIRNYINQFAAALNGPNFTDPDIGYAKYIDVDSFIDHHIMVEMTKNIDGYRLSTFMYLDRGGKLTMGPIWDYNLSLGNANYLNGWLAEGWYYPQLGAGDYPWYSRLFQDSNFQQRYIDRWTELRQDAFSTERLLSDIQGYVDLLSEAQVRNYQRWPILGTYVWPNWFIGNTYQEEIEFMTTWLQDRLAWIDSQWLAAPALSSPGGQVEPGFQLHIAAANDIYYTLDGTDPRLPGGAISPNAILAETSVSVMTLLSEGAAAAAFVPADGSVGTDWTQLGFDDSGWTTGTTGVGLERNTGYENLIGLDLDSQMSGVNTTAYIRVPFTVDDPSAVGTLVLNMKYDDGFVAYLNGTRVASANAPNELAWNSAATRSQSDAAALTGQKFRISEFLPLLRPGENVLAIQGLNTSVRDGDFLILPSLATDETPVAVIPLEESAIFKARATLRGEWSGLVQATFLVGDPPDLRITEIMYHPQNPPAGSPYNDDDFEFIELQNAGDAPIELGGIQFADGIEFTFPDVQLAPGGVVVIVSNQEAFESRYGVVPEVVGQYTGRLENSGEHLLLAGAFGETILDFAYQDDWYPETDGAGRSLEIRDVQAEPDTWALPASWRASDAPGGTPGVAGPAPVPGDTDGDGDVDIDDLNNVRNNFGGAGTGDTNGDGVVNIDDLNNVRNNFGAVAVPAGLEGAAVDAIVDRVATDVEQLRIDPPLRNRTRALFTRASRGHTLDAGSATDTALLELLEERIRV